MRTASVWALVFLEDARDLSEIKRSTGLRGGVILVIVWRGSRLASRRVIYLAVRLLCACFPRVLVEDVCRERYKDVKI